MVLAPGAKAAPSHEEKVQRAAISLEGSKSCPKPEGYVIRGTCCNFTAYFIGCGRDEEM